MIGELAAIGAALSWAISSLIAKPLTMRFESLSVNALRTTAAWPVVFIFLALTGRIAEISAISLNSAAYIISSGIIGLVIGTTLYLKALSLGDISKVYPVSYSCWLLITTFIAAIFLGEAVTWLTIVGALIIVLGIFLLAVSKSSNRRLAEALPHTSTARAMGLALTTGLFWAIGTTLLKSGLTSTDAVLANFVRLPPVFLLLTALSFGKTGARGFTKYDPKALWWVSVAGVLDQALGGVLYFMSIQLIGAAKATILSSTSPLFAAALAILFLRERVTLRTFSGTLCCVIGIWLTIWAIP